MYVGNQQFTARVVNVSAQGVLIVPPVDQPRGAFIRINLTLPALDRVIDVDGVVTREADVDGYRAWGVQFHEPSAEARALLETFVRWVSARHESESATPRTAVPTTTGVAAAAGPSRKAEVTRPSKTGSTAEKGGAGSNARVSTSSPSLAARATGPQLEKRASSSDPHASNKGLDELLAGAELRDLYREALGKDAKKDAGNKPKRRSWFGLGKE